MYSFPIFLNLDSAVPLVIGEGHLAVAKVRTLLLRAARVDVMANHLPAELQKFASTGKIRQLPMVSMASSKAGRIQKEKMEKEMWTKILAGRPLVVIDPQLDDIIEKLYPLCLELGLPINVADNIAKSSFSFGAMVDRRPLTVAIATDGIVPVLATNIREKLEQAIPSEVGELMGLARQYRARVNEALPMGLKRRLFWQHFLQGEVASLIRAGDKNAVQGAVEKLLASIVANKHPDVIYRNNLFLLGLKCDEQVDNLSLAMLRAIKNADSLFVLGEADIFSEILSLARREVVIKKISKQDFDKDGTKHHQAITAHLAAGESVVMLTEFSHYAACKSMLQGNGIHVHGFYTQYAVDNNDEVASPQHHEEKIWHNKPRATDNKKNINQ